jgi:hypothetical protein
MALFMMDDPVCPTDAVLLWWKPVAHWVDPHDGSALPGVWQCHKCRARFLLSDGELAQVTGDTTLDAILSEPRGPQ